MVKKRKAALIEDAKAKGFLPEGAEPRASAIAQTLFSPFWFLLIVPVFLIAVARQRIVVATDTDLYVLRTKFWKAKQVEGLEFTEPLREARAKATPFSIQIEGTERIYPMLGQSGEMKEIAAMTGGGQASQESAPA